MPLISIQEPDDFSKLALWEIDETEEYYLSSLNLSNSEKKHLNIINNKNRRLEWLCTRFLLNHVLNKSISISYNKERKPFLENSKFNISISHSKKIVGIYLHSTKEIGLDIEEISNKVEKVASRFLSHKELDSLPQINIKRPLTIYWCAKECVLKIHGKKDIDFKNQIKIFPFKEDIEGKLEGNFIFNSTKHTINLNYFQYKKYIILYGVKNQSEEDK